MKTLLFATDFSATAKHAARYGYNLARHLQANVVLCNAFIVPAEVPTAGMVVWPMDDYDDVLKDNAKQLADLKHSLEKESDGGFKPTIAFVHEIGSVADVVRNTIAAIDVDMVVVGTHRGGLGTFMIGDHSKKLIGTLNRPLLLVPPKAKLELPKKIAFATDFKHPEEDLAFLHALTPMARALGAEIHITHVYHEQNHQDNFPVWMSQFLTELSDKADYPFIFSKVIKNDHSVAAFDQLCAGGDMDMLVMVHRQHGFFEALFKKSHTDKMVETCSVPLLVLQSNK